MRLRSFIALVLLLACLVSISLYGYSLKSSSVPLSAVPGTNDFIAYWAGFRAAKAGLNPYSAADILSFERAEGFTGDTAQLFWNPPWLLTLFQPLLSLPLRQSALIWFVCNLLFVILSALLVAASVTSSGSANFLRGKPQIVPFAFLASAFFVPVWDTIQLGQLSLLISTAFLALVWALNRKLDVLAGLLLALLSIKPQTLYLVLLGIVFLLLDKRRWLVLCTAFLAWTVMLLLTALMLPVALVTWSPLQGSPTHWKSVTLVTVIRELATKISGATPAWPVLVVPLVTAIITLVWLFRKRPAVLDYRGPLIPILCASLITAPYGWIADQCTLAAAQIALVTLAIFNNNSSFVFRRLLLLVAALQLITFLLRYAISSEQYFLWFPFAILALWWHGMHLIERGKITR